MEYYCTFKDYANVIVLRNQLETFSEEDLINLYKPMDYYLIFVDTITNIINLESTFLLFRDSYIQKIEKVLNLHRFELDEDTRDLINEQIRYLNNVRGYPDMKKNFFLQAYLVYQEQIRNKSFKNHDDFLHYQNYDALLLSAIEEGNLDHLQDEDRFLSSLNYYLEALPEVFDYGQTLNLVLEHLDSFHQPKGLLGIGKNRKIAKYKNKIKRITKKEE